MAAFLLIGWSMKTQIASIFAVSLFVLSTAACHRNHARPAEGPVQKTKDAAKDVAHDTKDAAKDIKNDVKRDVK